MSAFVLCGTLMGALAGAGLLSWNVFGTPTSGVL
jgi:hypothetical protein